MLNSIIHDNYFMEENLKSRIWETLNLSMCVDSSNNNKKTQKKSRIWETLNLSMCVDSSNNNKKLQKK